MAGEHTLAEPKWKVTPWCTATPPNQCPYQVSTSYTLWNPRNSPDKILKLMLTMTRSKVKSRIHPDVIHPLPPTNVPTKYQLPTLYSYLDIARTRFYRSRVKSRSHHDVAHLHPLTNVPTKYQLSTLYSFWDTAQKKLFSRHQETHPPTHLDTMGENNTPTTLKGCGIKNGWNTGLMPSTLRWLG